MSNSEREKQIKKSIELIGWFETSSRIKTLVDRVILNRLSEEDYVERQTKEDAMLKKQGISF